MPTIDRAYQLAIQDERVRLAKVILEEKAPEAVGFALKANSGMSRGRGSSSSDSSVFSKCQRPGHDASNCWSKPVCSHCKKRGRESSGCYELHGYLEGWFDRPKTDGAGRGRGNANGRGRGYAKANAASSHNIGASSNASGASESTSSNQIFTPDQWEAIAGFFGNAKVPDNRLNGNFNTKNWIIDTGVTHHVTGDETWLFDVTEIMQIPVGLPNGGTVVAKKEGSIRLSTSITLKNVLYVPQLSCNFLSVSQLIKDLNCDVNFNSSLCVIRDQTMMLIGTGVRQDGLYYFREADSVQHVSVNDPTPSLELWHKRMGYPLENVVKLLPPVVGFKRHPSSCGDRYFLTIVDDYSRVVWVYLFDDKTKVFRVFMNFIAMVDHQFSQNIKIVQSDNGTKFNCLREYFSATGILFHTSCVGTPQQNGRVERKHKHILNVARALRFQAHLPIYFWGECVLAAVHYLINRTPTPLLQNKTPFEILFGYPPSYNVIRTFGCLCVAHNQKTKGDKFESRTRKCVFLGYPFGKKGWSLYDLEKREFLVSRDVKFFENVYPFHDANVVNIEPERVVPMYDDSVINDDFVESANTGVTAPLKNGQPRGTVDSLATQEHTLQGEAADSATWPREDRVSRDQATTSSSTQENVGVGSFDAQQHDLPQQPVLPRQQGQSPQPLPDSTVQQGSQQSVASTADLGRGLRVKTPSVLLRDYVTHTIVAESPSTPTPISQHKSGTPYPIAYSINYDNLSIKYRHFLAAIISGNDPKSYKEAMRHDGWRTSMQEEIRALEDNGTWILEELPPGKRALGSQ
ncbi:uncharacterized protein LOC110682706 [Chenopodium quinoa]|uniref:uncharacterized protein LOC110682706 n=1 Tax=Chenopodium quinoa TaxID=63459 RepID=UPI000B779654|nr:uncharacterized protein LOC110682706 [Chenopodium quinoa]